MTSKVKNYYKILGEKIRMARKQKGISQRKLAHILHVSDKAISSYEVGRTSPSVEVLEKLSKSVDQPLTFFAEEQSDTTTIEAKLKRIEKELTEVKELLKKKKISQQE